VSPHSVNVAFNHDQTRVALRFFHAKGNCITADMVGELRGALGRAAENPHLKLLTVEGEGADFSFGASIPEHAPDRIGHVLPAMNGLILDLLELPVPTAAIVRGRCLGGGFEIALACDFIFASNDATLGLPEVALGVFPPAGAALLPWRIGGARATRAILTGEARSAREWHASGLIEIVAAGADLETAVDAWFELHLAHKSAAALRHASGAVRRGLIEHVLTNLPALERSYLIDLMQTADAAEGIAAFMEKRSPRWRDR
jgi:cyclohexa-1,5-dienecarbonyl-CoA hydratase